MTPVPLRNTAFVSDEVEVQSIEAALRALGWADRASVARALRNWAELSEEVNAYPATVDDYTNDVCSRDYLAEVASRASEGLRNTVEDKLASADELFRTSTVQDTDGRLTRFFRIRADDGWWWHRRPSSGPLADYLAGAD